MRNRLFILATASFFNILCLMACAQEHAANEKKLSIANSIAQTTILLNNQDAIIPLKSLEKKNIASVSLGFSYSLIFDSLANKYDQVTPFSAAMYKDSVNLNNLEDDLKYYSTIIITLNDVMAQNGKILNFISNTAKHKEVILAVFGDGKSLASFDNLTSPIVWSPQNNEEASMLVPQLIFGGIAAQHKLTKAYSAKYTEGLGFSTTITRLKYTVPEDAGVNTEELNAIDKIANEAIAAKAAPGIVVLVAKDGKVIYNKAF
ncbi:MAG: beta-N-acetylglucosaminidase, partial [Pedobacter sp.]